MNDPKLNQSLNPIDYQPFFEFSTDILCVLSRDGGIEQANEAFQTRLGYPRPVLATVSLLSLVHPDDRASMQSEWSRMLRDGTTLVIENRIRSADGGFKRLSWKIKPVGEKLYAAAADMTEAKQAAAERQARQKAFNRLIETAPTAIIIADQLGTISRINASGLSLFGYTASELVGQPVDVLLPETLRAVHQTHRAGFVAQPEVRQMGRGRDLFGRCKDGTVFPIEVGLSTIGDGDRLQILAFVTDISFRKEQEASIRYQAAILGNITDAVMTTDLDFRIKSWNPAAEMIYGWTEADVLGRSVGEVLPTEYAYEDPAEVLSIFRAVGSWQGEVTHRTRAGEPIPILSSVNMILDETGLPFEVVAVNRDISAQKEAEQARQRTESRMKSILEVQHTYVLRTDLDGNYTFLNDAMFERFCWMYPTREEMIGQSGFTTIIEADHDVTRETVAKCIERPGVPFQVTLRKPTEGGGYYYSFWEFIGVSSANGVPVEIQCVGIDISDLKAAENALIESEQRFRQISETLPIPLLILDDHSETIAYANEAYVNQYPLDDPQVNSLKGFDATFGEDQRRKLTASVRESGGVTDLELEGFLPADGQSFWVLVTAEPIQFEGRACIVCTLVDITEQKRSTLRLESALKGLTVTNQALEQFTYAASHDLREPLNTIANFTQMFSEKYEGVFDDEGLMMLRFLQNGTERMKALVKALLDYALVGRSNLKVEPIHTHHLLDEVTHDLTHAIATSQAQIVVDLPPNETISADKVRLRQIFLNLISNAIKYRQPRKVPRIRIESIHRETHWEYRVSDNGIGIEAQHWDRIFEIFRQLHSSEAVDGVGLGLSLCRRIVHMHGDDMWVRSRPGQGSTFYFTISKTISADSLSG